MSGLFHLGTTGPRSDRSSLSTVAGKRRIVRGTIALTFGTVGALVAIAVAVGSVWYGFAATRTVDRVVERISMPIDRVESRLDELESSVESAEDLPALRARVSSVTEAATGVTSSLSAITDNPLYDQLPIDTDGLSARIDTLSKTTDALDAAVSGDGSTVQSAQGPIATEIDKAHDELESSRTMLTNVGSSLKQWLRISAVGGFFLAIWGFFGQLGLARWGRHLQRGYSAKRAAAASD